MPRYLIERHVPGIERMSPKDFQAMARRSNSAIEDLGQIQWVQSYVVGGRTYCVYIAPSEDMIREHARIAGFPVNAIYRVDGLIDPTTAEPSPG